MYFSLDPGLRATPPTSPPIRRWPAYLAAHPEIARDPGYFFGSFESQFVHRPRSAVHEMWNDLMGGIAAFSGFGLAIGLLMWLVRTFIDYHRWNRLSKVQTEVHTKILDRLTSTQDLHAYIQSPRSKGAGPILRRLAIELAFPMSLFRIALANLTFPTTPEQSLASAQQAIAEAGHQHARLICFPECYIPGYRAPGKQSPPPDPQFLQHAYSAVAIAAAQANLTAILGTERIVDHVLRITALVINSDGSIAGFQDKVQLDPSEEATYSPGSTRHLFRAGHLTFGIAICHEGWRYPETVRWAARRGAHIVFHPHFHETQPGGYQPSTFADTANTFHEKSALCRAAENTCFFATVNCASAGSPTTSAVIRPDGSVLCYQPYGEPGVLLADLDLAEATGLLASRYKSLA